MKTVIVFSVSFIKQLNQQDTTSRDVRWVVELYDVVYVSVGQKICVVTKDILKINVDHYQMFCGQSLLDVF